MNINGILTRPFLLTRSFALCFFGIFIFNIISFYNVRKFDIYNLILTIRSFFPLVIKFFTVGLPILGLFLWGSPYKRGFFCDDESLKHPFLDSTVRSWMLYIIGLVLPGGLVSNFFLL